ncbi:hypothetical protein [Teichococcus aestuarii]|uniref:Uncharacterized protein n=1 Tax=Teichococcus aestuarii TaxID=568898 RepID=A0A2U1UZ72_9PROT|nr:hypothetical protein [Pseudoroseomonas aestuarii]PWC26958.1 hypothetical protein CR165_20530 [Pseudoroseomonas aestuarii]
MGALMKVKPQAEEIPGLAAADAHAAELHEKYLGLRRQMRQAEADLAAGVRKRTNLLSRAKAGEVVAPAEVAEAEAATRTAESALMLLREAAPAVLKQLQEAEQALMALACHPLRLTAEAAQARYDAAVKAAEEAQRERNAAWEAHDRLSRWSVEWNGPDQVQQHAPAAVERRRLLSDLLEADRKAAATAEAEAKQRQAAEAFNRRVEEFKARNRAQGWPEDCGLADNWERLRHG